MRKFAYYFRKIFAAIEIVQKCDVAILCLHPHTLAYYVEIDVVKHAVTSACFGKIIVKYDITKYR